jgi:hypothetical protein
MNPSFYELPEYLRGKAESIMTRKEYKIIAEDSGPKNYESFISLLEAGANRPVFNALGLIFSTIEDLRNADYLEELYKFVVNSTFVESTKGLDPAYAAIILDTFRLGLPGYQSGQIALA